MTRPPNPFPATIVMTLESTGSKAIGSQGRIRMNVSIEKLIGGQWEARVAVATPEGARYFRERGQNQTAALLSLRQSLARYRGDSYRDASAAVLERALA